MFEIEFYRKHDDASFDWISEIHCLPIVKGISNFLKIKLSSNDFVFEEFVNDASEIQEIRRMLYEADFDNSPKPQREAYLWHYNIFGKALEKRLVSLPRNMVCLLIEIDIILLEINNKSAFLYWFVDF